MGHTAINQEPRADDASPTHAASKTGARRWWPPRDPRTMLRTILQLDDSPHSIAMGVAVGMFLGLLPTIGVQMVLVMLVAFLARPFLRFNRVAALSTVFITNPLTVVPIYYCEYWVGTWIFEGDLTPEDFARILEFHGLTQWWSAILELFIDVGAPLVVGSLIVATVAGVLSYPIIRWLIHAMRSESIS
ncbi:MAG: DUF2062 domain-containing protein [Planctomycetaceae bacterium]